MVYFNKVHHPLNFRFAKTSANGAWQIGKESMAAHISNYGDGICSLRVDGRWGKTNRSQAVLTPPKATSADGASLVLDGQGCLTVKAPDGKALLEPGPRGSLGVSGKAWMLEFMYDPSMRFYGLGEKHGALEKTGTRTKFWNTDVWADFSWDKIDSATTDPLYVSIPYIAVRCGDRWIGMLINNPYATFICAGSNVTAIANQEKVDAKPMFYLGADDGLPELWLITAGSLAELTCRYQRLVGTTPLPPIWSLGHHQCRWGYAGYQDLKDLKEQFKYHKIPNSGLWLDIDYMRGYRVFTWDPRHWDDVHAQVGELQADGQQVVPILDPGVKNEEGFAVAESGSVEGVWCQTPEGMPFVGFVWPGETLFPDFSRQDAREWWAEHVGHLAKNGIHGFWNDMNDPAVGPVELDNMCFGTDLQEHASFHNQYGAGMAEATKLGLLKAHPNKRPFLLGRSGYTGCQKHTAIWTGDNVSNVAYMAGSIPNTLNLALSGVPFNGPDVPGFGEDASETLALRWYQLGFLFPFLRNHCMKGNRAQEPWVFSREVRDAIAHLIRLRYRLIPYLYQLWNSHETEGSAVLRPLIYDFEEFDNCNGKELGRVDDQFMIGPSLMQAPITALESKHRKIVLPGTEAWYDLCEGKWVGANQTLTVEPKLTHTPLFARAGSVIPLQPVDPGDHNVDMARVDLHCFLRPGNEADLTYVCDDGASFDYQTGAQTRIHLSLRAEVDTIHIRQHMYEPKWRPLTLRIVCYGEQQRVRVTAAKALELPLQPWSWQATGAELTAAISGAWQPIPVANAGA